jgi:ADP-ribosylglycohydrolase
MYGAILGDIIGSPYAFDRSSKRKDFPLFSEGSTYTDGTVITIAVAKAFLGAPEYEEVIRQRLIDAMHKYARLFPHAGYGERFAMWLYVSSREPYNSYGNGAAVRAYSVAWLFHDLDTVLRMARLSAEVTHNHPEGIKGAQATASAIFLARTGHSKAEIKAYIEKQFGYDLSRTCDEIRPTYHHVESCQKTVPEAITAFLEGTSFEDVIRTAISLGGDCETLTAIAGSIAEGFYGVPQELKQQCRSRLPQPLQQVLQQFDAHIKNRA